MKAQAGILAMELKESIACPVCGSLEHPAPARRVKGVPTEEELKKSKKLFEERQGEYNSLLLDITKVKEGIDTLVRDIIGSKLEKLSKIINCDSEYDDETDSKDNGHRKRVSKKISITEYKSTGY